MCSFHEVCAYVVSFLNYACYCSSMAAGFDQRESGSRIVNNFDNLIILHTAHHNTDQCSHTLQTRKTIHTHAVAQHLVTVSNSSILLSEIELP